MIGHLLEELQLTHTSILPQVKCLDHFTKSFGDALAPRCIQEMIQASSCHYTQLVQKHTVSLNIIAQKPHFVV